MRIEFDATKYVVNFEKHGYSLLVGAAVLDGLVGQRQDDRQEYGETRVNAFGLVDGRLFARTYTVRGDVKRIISVRKANSREQREWQS